MATRDEDEAVAQERGLDVAQVRRLYQARGLTHEALRALPEPTLQRAIRRLEYADLPYAREALRVLQCEDEHRVVAPDALVAALVKVQNRRARGGAAAGGRVAGIPVGPEVSPRSLMGRPRTAGLRPDHRGWTALGPGNIGGRTRSIVVHPTNPKVLWAGSVGGGVWRTANGGASWAPVDDLMANLAVACMAMDPTDPDVIYAGTGEGFSNLDALRGAGIFRTVDGATWARIPATAGPEFHAVNRIALSRTGKTILAATRAGVFRCADAAREKWKRVLADEVADIDFHPTSVSRAVAGGLRNGQAYYTTDGGRTWKVAAHAGAWSGRVEVTYAAKDPAVVYASVDIRGGEVWRSTDGGRSYARMASARPDGRPAGYLGQQGWYDHVIWAGDPTDANLVVVGGIDLWRSTDGGNTLVDISTWWAAPRSAHADHHCIVAHPRYDGTTNRTVFFGNDGGVFVAEDVRAVGSDAGPPRVKGWKELVNTYGVTQFYGGAGNAATGTIVGGAQDNGTIRFTRQGGSEGWTTMFGGDGGWCAADPTDPRYFYGEYVYLNIHRSSDGGASAEPISGQFWNGQAWAWKPPPFSIPDAVAQRALFIAPFVLDPNAPTRLLAGGESLWRTNDARTPNTPARGPSWASIKSPVGPRISAIAVAPGASDLVWVGHEDGSVYRTDDGTRDRPVWRRIDRTGPRPLDVRRYCTRIVIDGRARDTVYVMFGGFARSNLWKTTDGGARWASLGDRLPEVPVRTLAVHPRRSEFLYIGTEIGVFASENGGAAWSPTNEGPTNCSVDELFWMGETLVAATHGRGMFTIDLSRV